MRRAGDDARVRKTRIIDRAGQTEIRQHHALDAFISDKLDPTLDDLLRHIAHIADVGGPDCIGIGPDLLETYRWIGAALLRGLQALGAPVELVPERPPDGPAPAFCFARTGVFEIEVDGRKLVGSAQRRQGESFLQHGAVLLGVHEPRLRALFPTTRDPLASLATLESALALIDNYTTGFHALGWHVHPIPLIGPDGASSSRAARSLPNDHGRA